MSDWRDDQAILCHCRNVKAGVVRAAVREHRPKRPEELGRICNAGTGCKSCWPDLETVMRQESETRGSLWTRLKGLFRGRRS
jgi:NAD(P)H-nitrite reductase large subunit